MGVYQLRIFFPLFSLFYLYRWGEKNSLEKEKTQKALAIGGGDLTCHAVAGHEKPLSDFI